MNNPSTATLAAPTPEIMVCGLTTLDIVTRSISLNQPVGAGCLRAIDSVDAYPGGLVSNSGLTLAKLGLATLAVSIVGDDSWGLLIRDQLMRGGLDVSGLEMRASQRTSTTIVLLDPSGERSFLFAPGGSGHWDLAGIVSAAQRLPRGSWVLFGYYSLFPAIDRQLPDLLSQLQNMGLHTAMDCAGTGLSQTPIDSVLPFLDCYIPSRLEAENQTQQQTPSNILAEFRRRGARGMVGLKLGSEGALLSAKPGSEIEIPVCPAPAAVIDTTGAGDAFYAGVLAGLTRGLTLEQAGRLGAAAGAWCVTGIGASSGLKGWQETCQLAGLPA